LSEILRRQTSFFLRTYRNVIFLSLLTGLYELYDLYSFFSKKFNFLIEHEQRVESRQMKSVMFTQHKTLTKLLKHDLKGLN
jgi:hypothetical protein